MASVDDKDGVKLERLHMVPLDGQVAVAATAAPTMNAGDADERRRTLMLRALVGITTLMAILYVAVVWSDRFESTSSFVIHSRPSVMLSQIASLGQGGGQPGSDTLLKSPELTQDATKSSAPEAAAAPPSQIVRSIDDAFVAQTYMTSRDMLRVLVKEAGLRERLARPEADLLSRWPRPMLADTEEGLYSYIQSIIKVQVDKKTGILQVSVQAFRPDDARELVDVMIRKTEAMLNRLDARGRAEVLESTAATVALHRATMIKAQLSLEAFRKANSLIDPKLTSRAETKKLSTLALEAASIRVQAMEVGRNAPNSPMLTTLSRRLAAVETQTTRERERLAGSGTSLGGQIGEYERLMTERVLAENAYQLSQATLEIARSEEQRQHYFIDIVSPASLPDYPAYPWRLLWATLTMIAGAALHSGLMRAATMRHTARSR